MSSFTKKAIEASFLKLLNETPLSNITVKMNPGTVNEIRLTGGCGDIALEALSVEPLD